jgi:magnesium transporter
MIRAFRETAGRLERLGEGDDLAGAIWLDLDRPTANEAARVATLGVEVPSLPDMEEIELSARLYREGEQTCMTVMLPGQSDTPEPASGAVTFILGPARLVTVRHHSPRPFVTYPDRAARVGLGCADPDRLFLSLMDEVIGRLADLLEGSGRVLDGLAARVYRDTGTTDPAALTAILQAVGRETEQIGRVRLALLTLERALGFYSLGHARRGTEGLRAPAKGLVREINALEEHADFLSSRLAMATEATLGMINLSQNQTIKIVSVVAVVFLPPTVIASAYGMNFAVMPELGWRLGYPMALGLMLASAVGTYLFFRWKRWL